jgi:S-formylglutathione hydrolase FrmB
MRRLPPLLALLALLCAPALPEAGPAAAHSRTAQKNSESRVECGAVQSTILERAVRFCALLPPAYDAQPARHFPVLYWLHGLGQDEQALVRSGGWTLVDEMRRRGQIGDFLIVTPDGDRSFYLNSRDGRTRYEDFFLREFLPAVERRFRTISGRSARGISGVSMGGFGALHLAMKYPQLFGSVSAHSAAVMEKPPAIMTSGARLGFLEEVFGFPVDTAFWERNSMFTLARRASSTEKWRIYFDCGAEDDYGFEDGNQALDRLLTARRIRHEFHLYPGGHSWSYFSRHLPASFDFHWKAFAAAREGEKPPKQ